MDAGWRGDGVSEGVSAWICCRMGGYKIKSLYETYLSRLRREHEVRVG